MSKELPEYFQKGNERNEIFEAMLEETDEAIIALAAEMGVPVETISPTKLKNKEATIQYLIKGGCPNCGKKKKEAGG